MRDFLINWHEKFQPLGPALKTPRIEVNEKSAIEEFEERSFDHPSCTGGNAPSLSPQALVPSRIGVIEVMSTPAAQMFKVGDRVRFKNRYAGCIDVGEAGVIESHKAGVVTVTLPDDSPAYLDISVCAQFLEPLPSQPSDTQQWVEWKGGECPVPVGTRVEDRMRAGSAHGPCPAIDLFWCHSERSYDVVAYRVVQ